MPQAKVRRRPNWNAVALGLLFWLLVTTMAVASVLQAWVFFGLAAASIVLWFLVIATEARPEGGRACLEA